MKQQPVSPPKEVEPEIQKLQRPELDPKIRDECYNMFNDIWYDFDEEKGVINKPKYLQVMNFVCQYKKIKKKEDGPFSDKRLEEDWDNEINTLYEDEDKQWFDRISHKDVLHITHNNLFDEK